MKTKQLMISVVALTLLMACQGNKMKEQQALAEISKQELATALSERDQLLELVMEIANGLEQIKQLEHIMTVSTEHPKGNPNQRAQMMADISSLKELSNQRQMRLQELESKLKNSTINNKELQGIIKALRNQIESQLEEIESLNQQLQTANRQIHTLNHAVDSLETTVTTITSERNTAQEASQKLENELNTCCYVIATKSELKEHNIIESGFLQKTKLMKGDFDKGYFVITDKRTLSRLPLGADKVKLLTTHPETSYELTEGQGEKILVITQPEQFWSLTNYLVVQKN